LVNALPNPSAEISTINIHNYLESYSIISQSNFGIYFAANAFHGIDPNAWLGDFHVCQQDCKNTPANIRLSTHAGVY
jgi:hypothetical protein